ncbi:coniferyl-alcohol dehydrogenase [Parazoarcus communis]|uniref:3-alpha-hydroxysteroid dehydrogenase n=1 Tax=Parazoarcus communis SWub3 = DSM 12120 TaxID=1121029 RepID=A0A323UTY5_9RHOO|nr:coniferyl-alcohol dehydrogenase [Parazoarcus communis]NMG72738.1 SDR family oxidoreductase [Parazoarcus communis SWub3 = DSM 12120]PZA14666.1 3-alpha-hydroxysteroid dehydrogenase [Azoarcus communis] [Parazoarcus communis SWub3 = DSM 12120]
MNLKGKNIVVTGAASGIGAETARLLSAEGATVIGVDRNPPAPGLVARHIAADLGEPGSIAIAAREIGNGIDALCNIAGLPPTRGRVPVLRVNFLGLRELTEALIPQMNDGAAIVNLASLAGLGWPDAIPAIKSMLALRDFDAVEALCDTHGIDDARSYFFSKEVLIAWTLQQRWTWRERGIRMNCVSPGPVDTPILGDFLQTLGARAEEDMRVMDRPGRPTDIAPLVAFLCSDDSGWLRGTNIACDGGMHSHVLANLNGLS